MAAVVYVPTAHSVGTVAPAAQKLPGGHAVQPAWLFRFVAVPYVPAAHGVGALACAAQKEPAVHAPHTLAPAAEKVPSPHATGAVVVPAHL
jgi:hypothetical protein